MFYRYQVLGLVLGRRRVMEMPFFPPSVLVLEGLSRRSELRLRHVWERILQAGVLSWRRLSRTAN